MYELAKGMAVNAEVYYLTWRQGDPLSPLDRWWNSSRDIVQRIEATRRNGVGVVRMPTWHRPYEWGRRMNRHALQAVIRRFQIDVVLNASIFQMSAPRPEGFTYGYHFLDLQEATEHPEWRRRFKRHVDEEVEKAAFLTACSQGLVEWVERRFKRRAVWIPNGTELDAFRHPGPDRLEVLRKRYGFAGRHVYGVVGNIGPWMGVTGLMESFRRMAAGMPDAVLMIVGPVIDARVKAAAAGHSNVRLTGWVPFEELVDHFYLMDTAILPNPPSEYQHHSFHAKMIEYTAAKKIIVSTPLMEVRRLKWPNIVVAEAGTSAWDDALRKSRSLTWNPAWNGLVEDFDWRCIAARLNRIMSE